MNPTTPPARRPLVLLADSDAAVGDALRFRLELEGFAVSTFPDAASMMAAALTSRPSCLIVDFDLPDMDGLALLGSLRKQGVSPPAVLISGHLAARFRAQAAIHAIPIMHKPLMEDELVVAVTQAVGAATVSA